MGEIAKIEIEVSQIENNQTKLINEHNKKLIETRNQSQEQLNSILAKIENVSQSRLIAQDRLDRAAIRSPVNGIVQRVLANTISSVFKSGADLVEIVPSGGALLIEAKILPVDIGFLRTNQKAIVKFTAYDHTIYVGCRAILSISAQILLQRMKIAFTSYASELSPMKSSLTANR